MQKEEEKEPVLRCRACRKQERFITVFDKTSDSRASVTWDFCRHCAVAAVTRRLPANVVRSMREETGGPTDVTSMAYYTKKGHAINPMLISKESGWLAPDGTFYPCEYGYHEKWAEQNGLSTMQMEKQGWLRLRWAKWEGNEGRLTQSQLDFLWDWSQANKVDMPQWAKSTEPL